MGVDQEDANGHCRIDRAQMVRIVRGPARGFTGVLIEVLGLVEPERFYWLVNQTALQLNRDRAIGECARQFADHRNRAGRVRGELARFMVVAHYPQDRASTPVPRV